MRLSLKLPLAVFLASMSLCLIDAWRYAQVLPARVACHFDAAGAPNGWSSRGAFVGIAAGSALFAGLLLLGASAKFRGLGREGQAPLLRLPNKDYWLAPERRRQTADFLAGYFLWFGAVTLLLLFDIFRQAFQANLEPLGRLSHPKESLAVYLAVVLLWTLGLQARFRRRPS